ncbi:uncharacterized protein J7T54_001958 [Emericellopsis cladophorae]|uniref:Uncharacterized protein n=1 Tax=Emericellopsis cladophorae TaxID=2686198 RepID=A0A9Q0BCT0_9HYPO|nr:uncharacterized protein J7T54_001958 [Emericellopsis cladophorae]KAI6779870.1 hypothetical protein J7T54_001958 [Emericellopsis cladophorae]
MPQTTTQQPKQQQPMGAQDQRTGVVTRQPVSEPRPNAESQPEMSLRGGGLHCGFDCCDGSCRFHKNCC